MNALESEAAIVARTAIDRARRPACTSGACAQGRLPCPSRQACMLPLEEDDEAAFITDLGTAGIACLIVVILIAVTVAAV